MILSIAPVSPGLTPPFASATWQRPPRRAAVGACLVRGLCGQDRSCRAQGLVRLGLDRLGRGGQESARSASGELAHELTTAFLALLAQALCQCPDLPECVGEVAVADRDEHSGARHALPQVSHSSSVKSPSWPSRSSSSRVRRSIAAGFEHGLGTGTIILRAAHGAAAFSSSFQQATGTAAEVTSEEAAIEQSRASSTGTTVPPDWIPSRCDAWIARSAVVAVEVWKDTGAAPCSPRRTTPSASSTSCLGGHSPRKSQNASGWSVLRC